VLLAAADDSAARARQLDALNGMSAPVTVSDCCTKVRSPSNEVSVKLFGLGRAEAKTLSPAG
jgi:hypothetical protein